MAQIIIKFLKNKLRKHYYSFLWIKAYWQDIKSNIKVTNTSNNTLTEQQMLHSFMLTYHIVEKALSFPNMRLGFAPERIMKLVEGCTLYINYNYNTNNLHFVHTLKVINEYVQLHEQNNYKLDKYLLEKVEILRKKSNVTESSQQLNFTKEEYLEHVDSSFFDFALSRHSIRNFSNEEVDNNDILKAINVALSSPSSCNRQPCRVYIVENKEIKDWALETQGGNRGFGQLINKLLIITFNLSNFPSIKERNEPMINVGMFSMSLIYALHSLKIGTVPLAYSNYDAKNDTKLHLALKIPETEKISLFIGCGHIPNEFKVASSPRYSVSDIVKII